MPSWGFKDESKSESIIETASNMDRNSPDEDSTDLDGDIYDYMKRGRPRAELITSLIFKGAVSHSGIRCHVCNRVFPREKSLQAHMRTHTGMYYFFFLSSIIIYKLFTCLHLCIRHSWVVYLILTF